MARRRRTTARSITKIIKAPAPIIRVSAPRVAPHARRLRRSLRRAASAGGHTVAGLVSNDAVQMALGGAMYGFAVKSGLVAKLPAIPVIGRTGTAAILLDYWSRHGGGELARRAARAAAAIAGYQLGHEGTITGDLTTTGDFAMGSATTPGAVNGDDGY